MTGSKIWSRDFILAMSSNFTMYVTYYIFISTLPLFMVNDLGAFKSDVGIVLAAFTVSSVIIRPFAGYALDTLGRRTVLILLLTIYVALLGGYFIAHTQHALIVLRSIQGLSWGFTTIAISTVAVDIIPPMRRGEGIGYFGISTTMGMALGPLIGLFLYHHGGFTIMTTVALCLGIISLSAAISIRIPKHEKQNHDKPLSISKLFDYNSIQPSLNLLVVMSTYGALTAFVSLYGREVGVENASLFFLICAIGIIFSRISVGKTLDRQGPKNVLSNSIFLMIVGYSSLAFFKNAIGFYISAAIIGYGIGVVFPTFQTLINNLAPSNRRGAANSTLYTALDAGIALGMAASGYIAQTTSIAMVFWTCSVVCVVGLLFFRLSVLGFYQRRIEK
jgi:predicted MFS family arabinose efflux permease